MFTLENDYLKISISENGGSMTSIFNKEENKELLYQPVEKSWQGQDVVIFPFIARLKNGAYMVDGKEYMMKNHGLIRYSKVQLYKTTDNSITLFFDSNEETLKQYPYRFHFEITYSLDGHKLSIKYKITNTDIKPIYYEFGGHPAIMTSGIETINGFDYEDTKIEFVSPIEVDRYYLDETGSYIIGKSVNKIPREVILKKKIIADAKTMIFDASNIDNVLLITNGHFFKFDTSDAEILAFWCDPHFGNFICVEPWWGIPDISNPNPELKDKPLMHSLNPSESEEKGYSIVISKIIL